MWKTTISAGGSSTTSGQLWSVQRGRGGSCHLKKTTTKKKGFKTEAEQEYWFCITESTDYKADVFQQGEDIGISVN